jgi:hypothetical protein
MTRVEKISLTEFFRRPAAILEKVFGLDKLRRELETEVPHDAARLWQRCNYFTVNPRMEELASDALHDIAFTAFFTMGLERLELMGQLPRGYVKLLWRDKPSFMHRAYEAEMASYFLSKGYSKVRLDEPDIVIPMARTNHFVACKKLRPGTDRDRYRTAIVHNLNKAIAQIAGKGCGTVMIEVDISTCAIDEMMKLVTDSLVQCAGAESISQVFLTWWDRNLIIAETEDRNGRVYAARRHTLRVHGDTGTLDCESPRYEGETIEWIDVPPVCDFRLSTVARSDDELNLVRASLLDEKFWTYGGLEKIADSTNSS